MQSEFRKTVVYDVGIEAPFVAGGTSGGVITVPPTKLKLDLSPKLCYRRFYFAAIAAPQVEHSAGVIQYVNSMRLAAVFRNKGGAEIYRLPIGWQTSIIGALIDPASMDPVPNFGTVNWGLIEAGTPTEGFYAGIAYKPANYGYPGADTIVTRVNLIASTGTENESATVAMYPWNIVAEAATVNIEGEYAICLSISPAPYEMQMLWMMACHSQDVR